MILIDATSTCNTTMNTGVQRVVRGLAQTVLQRFGHEARCLCWHPSLANFSLLNKRQQRLLFDSNAGDMQSSQPTTKLGAIPSAVEWACAIATMIKPEARSKAGDFFFAPEIFKDQRSAFFPHFLGGYAGTRVGFLYDLIVDRHPAWMPSKWHKGFDRYLRSLSRFDLVVSCSKSSASDFEDYCRENGLKLPQMIVEPLPAVFDPRPEQTEPPDKEASILCVGTLEPRKNHTRFLRACELLWSKGHHFRLVLVGRSVAGYSDDLVALIQKLKRKGRQIEWLMSVDERRLQREYRSCHFTVYPSLVEGFGLPILESLWHHRPCVCGSYGALGEVARGGGCQLMDPSCERSMSKAIARLINEPEHYQLLCREASARSFRTWDDYLDSLMSKLQEWNLSVSRGS